MKVRRHPVHTGLGPRVRVRPWAFDRGVIQVALADQGIVPTVDEIRGWVDRLTVADSTLRHVRTGALFAAAAEQFATAGFAVIDTLALLRIDLTEAGPRVPGRAASFARSGTRSAHTRTSRLRASRHTEAARIDRDAFGDPWGNDADDLAEIRRATPLHRACARFVTGADPRLVPSLGESLGSPRRALAGFAITGAAAGHGYLQRLAVAPSQQGLGHGRALVLDSLRWMRARRLGHGLVNTAIDNDRALGLYESAGFHRLPDRLVVMQFDVAAPGAAGS